jgi:hypothetical protein
MSSKASPERRSDENQSGGNGLTVPLSGDKEQLVELIPTSRNSGQS